MVVTVTGADDAAVIGGDTEGAVTEDDVDAARASGTLTVSDPDADQDGFEVQTEVGTYGKFALGGDGEWTYTLDNTDEDTDALGAGQKKTEAFTVESLGGTTAHVVVTVTGADDAAVIGGDTEGAVTEDDVDAARASGTLTVSDPDADQDGFEVQAEVGTYGKFALGEDGEWTYTLDNTDEDTDALGAGQKKTEAFTVASLGGTTAHVVVTVTGADDAAVIGGDTEGAVTEDDVEFVASGTLTVSDPDADQDGFEVQAEVGTYGKFALGEDGEWTYTLDNTDEDTDALGAGQKKTEAFTVESLGGTTAHVVVTVTGADDAAVIGGDTEGAVTEDDVEIVASGTLTVSDPDADQDGFEVQTEVGTYGKFALDGDGEWTYTLDNTDEDTDALGAGQKKTEAFTVASLGGTTAHVVVTVTGADDAAVIGGDIEGAVTEDDVEIVASGTLTVSDPDADQDGFEVQTEVGTYGKFALDGDGEWTYTLDNTDEDTDALGAGQKKTEAFTVASLGGTTAHVVVTVTGADDAAVIGGDIEGAVTEDDVEIAASGTLTVSDPDADQDGFEVQTEVGTYGKFALDGDGEWTYTLDNTDEDTDALGAGQKKTEAFTVESLGGTTAHVVVTVTGADDAAVIGGDTEGAVTEDDVEIVASGTLTVSDPDADQDGFEVQAEVGTYGTFALGEDGEWTYTLDNTDEDTDALGAGQKKTEAFTVTSLGGTTAQVEIVVRGADEAAVIDTTPAVEPDDDPPIIPRGDPENSAPRLPFGVDIGEPDLDPVQLPDSNGDELPAPEALLTMELRHETIFKDRFMLATGKPERNEFKLIAYWSMDKIYGNVIYDSVGDSQNAIFFAADGTPELVKPDAATEFGLRDGGAAARFDGNKATYIAIAHDDEFEVETGTIMFWFNADDTRGKQVLFAKDAAGPGNHLKIGLGGASLEIRMQNAADSHSIATDDIIEAGAWYHLILSFGADGMKLYVNGVQVGENAAAVGLQDNREPIVIGGSNHLNNDQSGDLSRLRVDDSFSGRIDEVMVYGRELDDRQALYLHERDATKFADSGSVRPASASTGEDWVWDVEAPEDGDAGADDILVRASEYVPVPDVPDWLMEVHETGFDDGYASELLAGTLVGLGVQGSRRSAGRRERNDTGELMG